MQVVEDVVPVELDPSHLSSPNWKDESGVEAWLLPPTLPADAARIRLIAVKISCRLFSSACLGERVKTGDDFTHLQHQPWFRIKSDGICVPIL